MRKPKNRNSQVSKKRLAEWVERFSFYRDPPNQQKIIDWLDQFEGRHRDVAARILDSVEMHSHLNVAQGYRDALSRMGGWHIEPARREGRWFFLGFGRPGASGHTMLSVFREANNLDFDVYDELFPNLADILRMELTSKDVLVFVDDVAGSGKQVCEIWPQIEEAIGGEARVFLLLSAVTEDAMARITKDTRLEIKATSYLSADDNIFSPSCKYFNDSEKDIALSYCSKVDKKRPMGFNDCGLLLVIYYKTPNNSIPILHKSTKRWMSLFPRRVAVT